MDYLEINKELWDNKTDIHYQSDFYDVASFLKGKDSLNSIELELLGDIKSTKILHLQCHFGMDSISLSRHGGEVIGVDFSERAISKAKHLCETLQTTTRFLQSDINSIIRKDMVLTDFKEYDFSPYNCFLNTVKVAEGRYQIKGLENKIPMIYSLVAQKAKRASCRDNSKLHYIHHAK